MRTMDPPVRQLPTVRPADARAGYSQAISILQTTHGNEHPDIAEYEDALRELSTGSPP